MESAAAPVGKRMTAMLPVPVNQEELHTAGQSSALPAVRRAVRCSSQTQQQSLAHNFLLSGRLGRLTSRHQYHQRHGGALRSNGI
jgi:hypothetical protein